jgi:hypothetical protein
MIPPRFVNTHFVAVAGTMFAMTSPPTVAAWVPQPVNDVAVLPV